MESNSLILKQKEPPINKYALWHNIEDHVLYFYDIDGEWKPLGSDIEKLKQYIDSQDEKVRIELLQYINSIIGDYEEVANKVTVIDQNSNHIQYPTAKATWNAIREAIIGVYKYKGSVVFEDLPAQNNVIGDVYDITNDFAIDGKYYKAGTNVAWNGTKWDPLTYPISDFENKVEDVLLDRGNGTYVTCVSKVDKKARIPIPVQDVTMEDVTLLKEGIAQIPSVVHHEITSTDLLYKNTYTYKDNSLYVQKLKCSIDGEELTYADIKRYGDFYCTQHEYLTADDGYYGRDGYYSWHKVHWIKEIATSENRYAHIWHTNSTSAIVLEKCTIEDYTTGVTTSHYIIFSSETAGVGGWGNFAIMTTIPWNFKTYLEGNGVEVPYTENYWGTKSECDQDTFLEIPASFVGKVSIEFVRYRIQNTYRRWSWCTLKPTEGNGTAVDQYFFFNDLDLEKEENPYVDDKLCTLWLPSELSRMRREILPSMTNSAGYHYGKYQIDLIGDIPESSIVDNKISDVIINDLILHNLQKTVQSLNMNSSIIESSIGPLSNPIVVDEETIRIEPNKQYIIQCTSKLKIVLPNTVAKYGDLIKLYIDCQDNGNWALMNGSFIMDSGNGNNATRIELFTNGNKWFRLSQTMYDHTFG